jgi:CRISPR system Cascade subunit CasB
MTSKEQRNRFIGYLLSLAREGQENRGALAELRSGLGLEPGRMARVHKHVVPYLPQECYSDGDRRYYTVATLFGLFHNHRKGYSLGSAFRPLVFPPNENKKESMEARFVALLNAHPHDLDGHLRHIVRLLESSKPPQPFDWFRLLDDLLQWDLQNGDVQMQWARDLYRNTSQTDSPHEGKETDSDE